MNETNPDPIQDGHTDIAHSIAQEWAKYRLSGEEWQILWVIIEKTWGWHKPWDNISLKQFYAATEMRKTSIIRALQKLISKNIVLKKENGNLKNYHINSHFNTWKMFSKMRMIKNVLQKENAILQKENKKIQNSAFKKDLQAPKETITKESTTSIKPKITFENDKFQNITEEKIQKWKEAFLNLDVDIQIKKMEVWLVARPKKRYQNYEKFIVGWLGREKGGKDGKYIPINSGERKGGEADAGKW